VIGNRIALGAIDDGGEGGGDYYAFDSRGVFLDGLEYTSGADNSGVEKILFGVCDVEVERLEYISSGSLISASRGPRILTLRGCFLNQVWCIEMQRKSKHSFR